MANSYDKYLKRLRGRIKQNPYYANARRTAFASTPDKFGGDQFKDAPIGFQAQHDLDRERIRKGITTDVVERAGFKDIERKEMISERIDEVQFQKDEYDRQKKDKFTDQLLTAGGAVLGGIVGSVVPGAGTLVGASLGASAGQILGGFTGDNSEDIGAGVASGIQTFTQISTDAKLKKLGSLGGEATELMFNLDKQGRTEFLTLYGQATTYEQRLALIEQYRNN